MIQIHDSLHAEHLRIAFVPVQRETMLRRVRIHAAGAEAIDREELIGVVELDHVPDHADRLLVPIDYPCFLDFRTG